MDNSKEQSKAGNNKNILKKPAKPTVIEILYKKGFLNSEAKDSALKLIQPPIAWWSWTNRILLFLGSALVLAGIVFFFAFNWAKMGPMFKFFLIEVSILVCVIGVLKVGLEKITGKILLLSAALLVGVFLAVFGQVYQTGADAYELFVGWSLLIAGWVFISKFPSLWLMWITLINTGLILFWLQVLIPNKAAKYSTLFILLALINTTVLALSHYGHRKGMKWLTPSWHHGLILTSILAYLVIPSFSFIVGVRHASAVPFLLLVLFLAGAFPFFRFYFPDKTSLTLCTLAGCIILLTLIGRVIFSPHSNEVSLLLFGIIVIGVFSTAAYWLRNMTKKINGEKKDD